MECMRSSVLFMGTLLARCGQVRLTAPGGCKLGARPIDLHISAMQALGASVEENGCEIICRAEKLTGGRIELPFPSVGATENAMIAACGADGVIVEVHNDPIHALCDGAQSLTCEQFAEVARKVRAVREAVAE